MTKYPYDGVGLREHPESYRVGRGEQGVFHAEPYKSEMIPLWSFKDEAPAKKSSDAIFEKFIEYKKEKDFVGMDVARKFLQMGCTRAMRYAKHEGGDKSLPRENSDPAGERCAALFHEKWRSAAEDAEYLRQKKEHRERNERG